MAGGRCASARDVPDRLLAPSVPERGPPRGPGGQRPLWRAVRGRAALVLNGHDHNMQQFKRRDGIVGADLGRGRARACTRATRTTRGWCGTRTTSSAPCGSTCAGHGALPLRVRRGARCTGAACAAGGVGGALERPGSDYWMTGSSLPPKPGCGGHCGRLHHRQLARRRRDHTARQVHERLRGGRVRVRGTTSGRPHVGLRPAAPPEAAPCRAAARRSRPPAPARRPRRRSPAGCRRKR